LQAQINILFQLFTLDGKGHIRIAADSFIYPGDFFKALFCGALVFHAEPRLTGRTENSCRFCPATPRIQRFHCRLHRGGLF